MKSSKPDFSQALLNCSFISPQLGSALVISGSVVFWVHFQRNYTINRVAVCVFGWVSHLQLSGWCLITLEEHWCFKPAFSLTCSSLCSFAIHCWLIGYNSVLLLFCLFKMWVKHDFLTVKSHLNSPSILSCLLVKIPWIILEPTRNIL